MNVRRFDSYQAFLDDFERAGGSDGLPVVPPTEDRVERFLRGAGLAASDELSHDSGEFRLTAERLAIQAVLAGCQPQHAPVVVAAVRACFSRTRGDAAEISALGDSALCVVVNGPIRQKVDLQCGPQCFGPGFFSNATIGRAVNLIVGEVEAHRPRAASAFSTPDAYSFCFGEDEEGSPWEAHHVERGFAPEESVVTVHSVQASLPSTDPHSREPEGVLDTLARTLMSRPALAGRWPDRTQSPVLVVGVEQQRVFADAGWTRADIRNYLRPRLCDPALGGLPQALGELEEMPIFAAGGRGMSWIWILVAYAMAPAMCGIEAGGSA